MCLHYPAPEERKLPGHGLASEACINGPLRMLPGYRRYRLDRAPLSITDPPPDTIEAVHVVSAR